MNTMKFTPEEKQKLSANLQKVADFLDTKIVPQMRGTQFTVDFGEEQNYCNPPYREKELHLYVSPLGYSMRIGGLGGIAIPPSGDHAFYGEQAGLVLLKEWPSIKAKLVAHINGIQAATSLLDDFDV